VVTWCLGHRCLLIVWGSVQWYVQEASGTHHWSSCRCQTVKCNNILGIMSWQSVTEYALLVTIGNPIFLYSHIYYLMVEYATCLILSFIGNVASFLLRKQSYFSDWTCDASETPWIRTLFLVVHVTWTCYFYSLAQFFIGELMFNNSAIIFEAV
jgi:hypothetical protein